MIRWEIYQIISNEQMIRRWNKKKTNNTQLNISSKEKYKQKYLIKIVKKPRKKKQ